MGSRRRVHRYLVAGGIAVLLVIAVVLSLRPPTPEKVAQQFMEALRSGNFARAYGLLDLGPDVGGALGRQAFAQAMKQRYGDIRSFRLDFQRELNEMQSRLAALLGPQEARKYSAANYREFCAYVDAGGRQEVVPLFMVNTSTSSRPRWRVDPEPFLGRIKVLSLPGASVTVGSQRLQVPDSGVVELEAFVPVSVSVSTPESKPFTQVMHSGGVVKADRLDPNDELRAKLVAVVEGFNRAWIEAVRNADFGPCQPFVDENYPEYRTWDYYTPRQTADFVRQQVRRLRENGERWDSSLLRFHVREVYLGGKQGEAVVVVEEEWNTLRRKEDGTLIEDRGRNAVTWEYHLIKGTGGWRIAWQRPY